MRPLSPSSPLPMLIACDLQTNLLPTDCTASHRARAQRPTRLRITTPKRSARCGNTGRASPFLSLFLSPRAFVGRAGLHSRPSADLQTWLSLSRSLSLLPRENRKQTRYFPPRRWLRDQVCSSVPFSSGRRGVTIRSGSNLSILTLFVFLSFFLSAEHFPAKGRLWREERSRLLRTRPDSHGLYSHFPVPRTRLRRKRDLPRGTLVSPPSAAASGSLYACCKRNPPPEQFGKAKISPSLSASSFPSCLAGFGRGSGEEASVQCLQSSSQSREVEREREKQGASANLENKS